MKIKAILNKIFDLVLNFLISFMIICLIIAMYSFINLKILNNKYTNFFGYTYFEILSGSMEKEISVGDYVFVKITKDVKENDIISFTFEDDVITHRVISIDGEKIITKGDNNNVSDDAITKNEIIGKVLFIGDSYGKYVDVFTEPIVFISFFVTIILFNIAFSKDNQSKERSVRNVENKKKQEENET